MGSRRISPRRSGGRCTRTSGTCRAGTRSLPAYNPLWVAALALTFFTLVPLLRPDGPSGIADAAVLGGGLLALAATHPYSTLVVLAVAVTRPVLGWLVQVPRALAGVTTSLMGLLPALAVIVALAAWQNADAVYRATATGTLGPQALSVFWYPVTLGVTGVFAVRGWRTWLAEANPCALPMAAWTLAVIFLHTSTVLNGYHFVFHLYTPICLAAAPAMVRAWDGARGRPWGMVGAAAVGVLLVQAPLLLTRKCLAEVESHRINQTSARVLDVLATMPGGNVLAPADLGNFVPAYGPHRVYTGHWFLTPQYTERANQALAVATGRTGAAELIALVDAQHLDYLVVATQAAPALASALGARVARTIDAGELTLMVLAGESGGRAMTVASPAHTASGEGRALLPAMCSRSRAHTAVGWRATCEVSPPQTRSASGSCSAARVGRKSSKPRGTRTPGHASPHPALPPHCILRSRRPFECRGTAHRLPVDDHRVRARRSLRRWRSCPTDGCSSRRRRAGSAWSRTARCCRRRSSTRPAPAGAADLRHLLRARLARCRGRSGLSRLSFRLRLLLGVQGRGRGHLPGREEPRRARQRGLPGQSRSRRPGEPRRAARRHRLRHRHPQRAAGSASGRSTASSTYRSATAGPAAPRRRTWRR